MTTVDQDFLSNHHRAFMPCIAYVLQHILALVTFDPFLRPKTAGLLDCSSPTSSKADPSLL